MDKGQGRGEYTVYKYQKGERMNKKKCDKKIESVQGDILFIA